MWVLYKAMLAAEASKNDNSQPQQEVTTEDTHKEYLNKQGSNVLNVQHNFKMFHSVSLSLELFASEKFE